MYSYESPEAPRQPWRRTLAVLALLVSTAGMFSFLGAYAITDAMVKAHMMNPLSTTTDPRPMWMARIFVVLMTLAAAFFRVNRLMSKRQFRKIDELAEEGAGDKVKQW